MSRVTIEKIRWKNVLSFGNAFTEIDFSRHDTTLVVGPNGVGKSCILEILTFGLFGKPFRKINKAQLVNSITKQDLLVEVFFSIGEKKYTVTRGLKPNVFEIRLNGELINQSSSVKDYQDILEKTIIGCGFKTFTQIVILGSASYVPFMQLPVWQRRELIEDLLDLQIFTSMNAILKERVRLSDERIHSASTDQRIVEEKVKLVRIQIVEQQQSVERVVAEKTEAIDRLDAQIVDMQNRSSLFDAELTKLKNEVSGEAKLSARIRDLTGLKHQIEAKVQHIEREVDFFSGKTECPSCTQPITDEFRKTAIASRKRVLDKTRDGYEKLIGELDSSSMELERVRTVRVRMDSVRMEQFKLVNSVSSCMRQRTDLVNEIDSLLKKQESGTDLRIEALEEEASRSEKEYNAAVTEREVLAAAGTMLRDSGIKSRIIKQYVPVINKLINKYLAALELYCCFELDEEFNEKILSRNRDDFSYESFSEGEKARIDLAILFAWRAVSKMRSAMSTNLLILDECFDGSLDLSGSEELQKLLSTLQGTNVVVISHKTDVMIDKFQNVLAFEKTGNFSHLVE